jgi:hypothetical protein
MASVNNQVFVKRNFLAPNTFHSLSLQFVLAVIGPVTRHSAYSTQVILLRLWLDVVWGVQTILFRCLHWFQKLKSQPFAEVRHLSRYFVRLVAQ